MDGMKQTYQISLTLVGREEDIQNILKEIYKISAREEVTAMNIEEVSDYRNRFK